MNGAESGRMIVVDRQITLPDFRGEPNAIARLPDGGFIIVGAAGAGIVVVTDSAGEERWTYHEPLVGSVSPQMQSAFLGAVPLKNGNVLVCGYKLKGSRKTSALLIFDSRGQIVEQQLGILPFDVKNLVASEFDDCYSWDGGIAVVGDIITGTTGYGWVIKLDENGSKISEQHYEYVKEPPVTSMKGASFIRVAYKGSMTDGLVVVRENAQGEVIATRDTPGDHFLKLRDVELTDNTSIISYKMGKATLYTLSYSLADVKPPVDIGTFYAVGGAGYVLADGSLALFGRTNNAAVAWISQSGLERSVFTFDPKNSSFVLKAALPLSSNQFLTARMSGGGGGKISGLTMAWITIK